MTAGGRSTCSRGRVQAPLLIPRQASGRGEGIRTCESENRNTVGWLAPPACLSTRLRSSRHSFAPYDLEISIENDWYSPMKVAMRVRLCRPLPPTPTSSALPYGCLMMREMRQMCSAA